MILLALVLHVTRAIQQDHYEFLRGENSIHSVYFISDKDLIAVKSDGRIYKYSDSGKTKLLVTSLNEPVVYTQQFAKSILIVTLTGQSASIDSATLAVTKASLPEDLKKPLCVSSDESLWAGSVHANRIPVFSSSNGKFQQKATLGRVDRPRSAFFLKTYLVYDHVRGNRRGISVVNLVNNSQSSVRDLDKEIVRCLAPADASVGEGAVCGTEEGDIVILDPDMKPIERIRTNHPQLEFVAATSRHVIAISDGGFLCVYDLSTKSLTTLKLLEEISPSGISVSPSGKRIVVWTADGDHQDRENKGYAVVHSIVP